MRYANIAQIRVRRTEFPTQYEVVLGDEHGDEQSVLRGCNRDRCVKLAFAYLDVVEHAEFILDRP